MVILQKKHKGRQSELAANSGSFIQNIRKNQEERTHYNLINYRPDIDKIYFYAKDSFEEKHQFLINKHKSAGLKDCNSKAFIEC